MDIINDDYDEDDDYDFEKVKNPDYHKTVRIYLNVLYSAKIASTVCPEAYASVASSNSSSKSSSSVTGASTGTSSTGAGAGSFSAITFTGTFTSTSL